MNEQFTRNEIVLNKTIKQYLAQLQCFWKIFQTFGHVQCFNTNVRGQNVRHKCSTIIMYNVQYMTQMSYIHMRMSDTKSLGVGHYAQHVKTFFRNTATNYL